MHVVVTVGAIQPPYLYPKLIQGVYWLIIVQSGSFIPGTIARHIRSYYGLFYAYGTVRVTILVQSDEIEIIHDNMGAGVGRYTIGHPPSKNNIL